jgi:site-specific recombinase XerC
MTQGTHNLNLPVLTIDTRLLDKLLLRYLARCQDTWEPRQRQLLPYWLSRFGRWWAQEGPHLAWQLTPQELHRFANELEIFAKPPYGEPLSDHHCNCILSALREALHWAFLQKQLEHDFSTWVPSVQDANPTRAFLRAAGQGRNGTRNQAILAIFIGTDIRPRALAQLDLADIEFDGDGAGVIHIRRRQGGKPTTVAFDKGTGAYLKAHWEFANTTGVLDGPLWTGHNGNRLSVKALNEVVKVAAARMAMSDLIQGQSDLRRVFATEEVRHGGKPLSKAAPLTRQPNDSEAPLVRMVDSVDVSG